MHILPDTIKYQKRNPIMLFRLKALHWVHKKTWRGGMLLFDLLSPKWQCRLQWLVNNNYIHLEEYNHRTRRARITAWGRFSLITGIL